MKENLNTNEGTLVKVHSVNLLVLRCADLEASIRFYASLGLGFQRGQYIQASAEHVAVAQASIPHIKDGEEASRTPSTTLWLQASVGMPPTTGLMFGLYVSSVDLAVDRALAAGGRTIRPPFDWPFGRAATLEDPDGNRVEITSYYCGRPWGDLQ